MDSPSPNPTAPDPVVGVPPLLGGEGQGEGGPVLHTQPSHLSLPTSPPPQVPDYELLRRIGSGSYGDVWLARNVLGQCRAVKIIYRSRFVDPRPFEREFEGIQRFEPISRSHPSQLAILHVGKNDAVGCFYYVMELADDANAERGTRSAESTAPSLAPDPIPRSAFPVPHSYVPHTLRHDLELHTRLPIPDCVQIGLSLATALAHLHEQGLVHRDIKPSNIIFVNGVAKLGDIGLVTEAGDTQSIVGTEGYLPPEGPGTPQADLFSLGKVLYEISTGMDRRRFAELPDDLRTWEDRAAVVEFNEIVLRACAKDPAQRYGTTDDLRADLELLTTGQSVKKARSKERRWWMAKRVAVAAVLIGITLGTLRLLNRGVPSEVAEGGPPSTNEMANALCDKALRRLRADAHREFPEVYTNLHRAIELDPHFARPYVGLMELVVRESILGVKYLPEDNERTITQRLVELAPESAGAQCGVATIAFYDWDFPAAEHHALSSIRIAPDYELAHTTYGFMLLKWGRPVEARRQLEIALGLNPSKVQIHRILAHSYYVERDFPRAIEKYREAINWQSRDLPAQYYLGWAYRASGEYEKAIDTFETAESLEIGPTPEVAARFDRLRQTFKQSRERGYWQEEWNQAPTNGFYQRAKILAHLGATDDAFKLLNQAYQAHERIGPVQDWLTTLVFDEAWDPYRRDPRFKELLDKIGFTKVNPKLRQ